jgi:hypothetical protein
MPEVLPEIDFIELEKWYIMQEELRDLREKEAALRLKIFKNAFPLPKEGTNKKNLPKGWVLNATLPITRKVDLPTFLAMKDLLIENHIKADKLVEFKPELSVKQYRCLTEEEIELVDQFLIIKEGSPSMKIVLPAEAKKQGLDQ